MKTRKVYIFIAFILGIYLSDLSITTPAKAGILDYFKAHLRHARLEKELKSRQLIVPNESEHGFSPDAFVMVGSMHLKRKNFTFIRPTIGFAIGDGSLVLTAAHCLRPHHKPRPNQVPTGHYIISPYYGDFFEYKILAIDDKSDIAVLKPKWTYHPALQLGTEQGLKSTNEVYVCGKRLEDTDLLDPDGIKLSKDPDWFYQVRMEKLNLWKQVQGATASNEMVMKSARFVLPGWSGSAVIHSSDATIIGILTQHKTKKSHGVTTSHPVFACSITSIEQVLKEIDQLPTARAVPMKEDPVPHAKKAFQLSLNWYRPKRTDPNAILKDLQAFTDLRPDSKTGLRILGSLAGLKLKNREDLYEQAFAQAIQLDPNDAMTFALHGRCLLNQKNHDRALAQTQKSLSLNPNCLLASLNICEIHKKIEPHIKLNAAQTLVSYDPNSPLYHHYESDILYRLGQYPKALHAAQEAIRLDPNGPYRRAMGKACAKLGRIDEAQQHLEKMTDLCACSNCWSTYANFIINYRSEDTNALRLAEEIIPKITVEKQRQTLEMRLTGAKLNLVNETSPDEALRMAKDYIQEDPNCADYWWILAGLLRSNKQYQEAADMAQKAVDLNPKDTFKLRLANCLSLAGHIEKAEETYTSILQKHPDGAQAWFWYAEFLIDHYPKHHKQIEEALEKAATPYSDWPVDANDLAELCEQWDSQKHRDGS